MGWKTILITWSISAAISLLNVGLLLGLVFPPYLLIGGYIKWFAFLIPPVLVAALMSLAGYVFLKAWLPRQRIAIPVLVNLLFWGVFFLSAEGHRAYAMAAALPSSGVDCHQSQSFLHAVMIGRKDFQTDHHAVYIAADDVHLWSYRDLDYYRVEKRIYQNLDLGSCEPPKDAIIERTGGRVLRTSPEPHKTRGAA